MYGTYLPLHMGHIIQRMCSVAHANALSMVVYRRRPLTAPGVISHHSDDVGVITSSGKPYASVWRPSVRLSVPSFF